MRRRSSKVGRNREQREIEKPSHKSVLKGPGLSRAGETRLEQGFSVCVRTNL